MNVNLDARCLERMGCGGERPHVEEVEVFDLSVAACRGCSRRDVYDGEHVHDRCLRLDCVMVLLPDRLVRTRGSLLLEMGPPALRICMETTRASSLWQAAVVRPEPERMPSLRCAGAPPKVRVWGLFVFCYIKCCSR